MARYDLLCLLKAIIEESKNSIEVAVMSKDTRVALSESYRPRLLEEIIGLPVEIDDTMGSGRVRLESYPNHTTLFCCCSHCTAGGLS